MTRSRSALTWLGGGAIAIVLFALGYFVGKTADVDKAMAWRDMPSLTECIDQSIPKLNLPQIDLAGLWGVSNLCNAQIYNQGSLNDFHIRRLKFFRQDVADIVILWMVVAITLSGVGLAGLQLWVSYRLASEGRGQFGDQGELAIERDRISLKSSVTGLFILAISLAFFLVYAIYIYKIEVVGGDQPSAASSQTQPSRDGLGPPPGAKGAKGN